MVKHKGYKVTSSGVIGNCRLCRKDGTILCYICTNGRNYWVNYVDCDVTMVLSPKCGMLFGCHAVEIDITGKTMAVRIPKNSGFVIKVA